MMKLPVRSILIGMLVLFAASECNLLFGEDAALTLYITRHAQRGPKDAHSSAS